MEYKPQQNSLLLLQSHGETCICNHQVCSLTPPQDSQFWIYFFGAVLLGKAVGCRLLYLQGLQHQPLDNPCAEALEPGCCCHVWGRGRNAWMISSPPQCHTLHLPLPLFIPSSLFPFCSRNPAHYSTTKTGTSPIAPCSWQGAGWKSSVTMAPLGCLIIPLPGPALSQQSTKAICIQIYHLKNPFWEPEQDTRLLGYFFFLFFFFLNNFKRPIEIFYSI